jgi:hypothetical protein
MTRSLILAIVILIISSTSWSQSSDTQKETQLQEFIAELRSSKSDIAVRHAIREKIIKLVATMPTPPKLPEEAEKHGFRAEAMLRLAKTPLDFQQAADEYAAASMSAPWVAEYYENWALQLEKAGNLSDAKDKLELYLLGAPNASDRTDVKRKIAELEVLAEKKAAAEAQQKELQEVNANVARYYQQQADQKSATNQKFVGNWSMFPGGNRKARPFPDYFVLRLTSAGDLIKCDGYIWQEEKRCQAEKDVTIEASGNKLKYTASQGGYDLVISADGSAMTGRAWWQHAGHGGTNGEGNILFEKH